MPSSSRLLSLGALALSSSLARPALATTQYTVVNSFAGQDFFNNFAFSTEADPTHGFVQYVDQATAQSLGLINVTPSGSVYIGVDHISTLSPSDQGRKSVRITSNVGFDQGLLIADIQHMPGSICGVWPAFWTTGNQWPEDGEIDIIEGVNQQATNEMVLHTQGQCTITNPKQTGTLTSADCSLSSGTTGCVVQGTANTYGTGFNSINGGVYALLWTDEAIKIWFFPRSAIPESITSGNPNPDEFGTPLADFEGTCDIGKEFQTQKLVFDTTFCGDWAGGVYGSSGCPMSQPNNAVGSCVDYVASNPSAFTEAYWEINSIKIYQQTNNSAPSSSALASRTVASSAVASSVPADAGSSTPAAVTPFSSTAAASSKETATTVIVTSYVDVCPEGFTTKTITHTATYCPEEVTSGIAPGFTTKTTVCTACGPAPTTVTLTVPASSVTATATPAATSFTSAQAVPGSATTFVSVPVPTGSGSTGSGSTGSGAGSSSASGSASGSAPSSGSSSGSSGYGSGASSSVAVPPVVSPSAPAGSAPYPASNGTASSPSGAAPVASGWGSASKTGAAGVGSVATPSSKSSSSVPPVFTGAANKVSAGLTGAVAAVALALLA
ncbi:hypothetical protein VTN96DRAFT_6776 [Rasamsonia emersonii]|uniref:endo-1,3(4)-beta-glucanase n=1 Tax=Rasamsonia emersonii (strain ATCC 16479 / CBS 393.64 / IMI 116815) TaxID=1408163 RepID=A0A0F4YV75_RASE3|nr:hypothetical protein T310_3809 [Rasamsonia emersonii CBS 393.64]KKA22172.1 hypothetical protein T310_3809 [Rasamsonia emersonii CBS 393.64]